MLGLDFLRSKPDTSKPEPVVKDDTRYGMYKNLAVGQIKFVENKVPGHRQHFLIGGIEMTTIKDGIHRATMNRFIYIPEEYNITKDMCGKWCLYGYYYWSNRLPIEDGEKERYNNIITLKHFQLLEDEQQANAVAFEIMDSIKTINFLTT